ncbi:MAG: cytochrome c biogenesis protein CcsA, partial [Calditrichia bacterium]|nr:cytochrome c biogenesis protein CcsA [Calditrichia bacterium]
SGRLGNQWLYASRRWTLFAWLFLGAGNLLGAQWAYTVLGWGGFWGWDPVENSSLVPWVVLTVLLHGLILQHKKKALLKTNLFMGALSFILVVYGMFLTRSGVLTDFSVHSFGESELNSYLMFFLLFFLLFFLVVFFINIKSIKGEKLAEVFFNRETFMILGMLILFLSAFITFVGMSFPIISSLWGNPANVPIKFYNYMHIPIGLLIVLLAGIAVILKWNSGNLKNPQYLYWGTGVAFFITAVANVAGFIEWRTTLFLFFSIVMMVVNGLLIFKIIKDRPLKAGSYLTHFGIGLMFIGILVSAFFSQSQTLNLPINEEVKS